MFSPVLGCTIHEHSFASRCVMEFDSTDATVSATQTEGRQTTVAESCVSRRYSVCPAQRDSLGDAAAGTGLWFWHDLLAAVARLARGGYLATDPLLFAGLVGALRTD